MRAADDVARLPAVDVEDAVAFVFERCGSRAGLDGSVPLSFAGAPFTLASYLIEAALTRVPPDEALHARQPAAWHAAWSASPTSPGAI